VAFSLPMTTVLEKAVHDLSIYENRMIAFVGYLAQQAQAVGLELDATALTGAVRDLPILKFAGSIATHVGSVIVGTTLVVIFLIFLVVGQKSMSPHVGIFSEIDGQIRKYLNLKILLSLAISAVVGAILYSSASI
jgi:hypothetical protein